jgi:hypothetical protein
MSAAIPPTAPTLSPSARRTLRAVAVTVVPEARTLDARGWEEMEQVVSAALATRPASLQRQFSLFLRVIEWIPVLWSGRPFAHLDAARRERFLTSLQNNPLLLLRRGFWGLRTLILMGYYTQRDVATAIGYRAEPRGWRARR